MRRWDFLLDEFTLSAWNTALERRAYRKKKRGFAFLYTFASEQAVTRNVDGLFIDFGVAIHLSYRIHHSASFGDMKTKRTGDNAIHERSRLDLYCIFYRSRSSSAVLLHGAPL